MQLSNLKIARQFKLNRNGGGAHGLREQSAIPLPGTANLRQISHFVYAIDCWETAGIMKSDSEIV